MMHDDYINDMFRLTEQFGDEQTITVAIDHPDGKLYVACTIEDLSLWVACLVGQ